jgi:tRNA(Ile)-lysidine synthase
VHSLAQHLLNHIQRQELLHPGDRVGVAVSGGIDSVALLRLLLELRGELGIVLSVVHFNHKLRGAESDADQEFVTGLAREHGLEFYCSSGDAAERAAEEHSGLEAAARELRYEFFYELVVGKSPLLAKSGRSGVSRVVRLDKIATGHTLDDQAETVLMRLIRGTGLRGLGGIHPRILVENEDKNDEENEAHEFTKDPNETLNQDPNENCHGEIVRPMLGIRRAELKKYLIDRKQPWREDATNSDLSFTRNRIRKIILPLLERDFNPSVVENLSELAEIARDEEDYWENETSGWLGTVVQWTQPGAPSQLVQILPSALSIAPLSVAEESVAEAPRKAGAGRGRRKVPRSARDDNAKRDRGARNADKSDLAEDARQDVHHRRERISVSRPWLLTEPKAVQRRVIKAVGTQAGIPLEFKHVEEILRLAAEDGPLGKELSLPLGWNVVREPETMVFVTPDLRHQDRVPDYEYRLAVPGRVIVPETGTVIEALRIAPGDDVTGYNPQQLLRVDLLAEQLLVRNWRAGDRFWPAHTKGAKKVKELLQQLHVEQPERRLWPVAVNKNEIVWMRGFPVPAKLRGSSGQEAVLIHEMPFVDDGED